MDPKDQSTAVFKQRQNEEAQWINALGSLVYHFGLLEAATVHILHQLRPDKPQLNRLHFGQRAERAREEIGHALRQIDQEMLADEWEKLTDSMKQAGIRRNDIVHNPLIVQFGLDDFANTEMKMGVRHLRIADMPLIERQQVEDLTLVIRDLYRQFIVLRASSFSLLHTRGAPGRSQ